MQLRLTSISQKRMMMVIRYLISLSAEVRLQAALTPSLARPVSVTQGTLWPRPDADFFLLSARSSVMWEVA